MKIRDSVGGAGMRLSADDSPRGSGHDASRGLRLHPITRDGQLMGIITDRDITARVVAEGRDPGMVQVEEVMTPDTATVSPNEHAGQALERMSQEQVRRLPVVEGQRLVGLVAMGELAQKVGHTRRWAPPSTASAGAPDGHAHS